MSIRLQVKKKTLYYSLLFFGVIFVAIIARIVDLPNRVIFTEDHGLINIFAYKNVIYHEPQIVGSSIGGVWATFPPTYFHLTNYLIGLTNFNYLTLHTMTIIANLLALILMAIFLPRIFGFRATLVSILIYGLSFHIVSQSLVGLNPGAMPPLTVILLLSCIWYFKERRLWALPIAVVTISLTTHLHVTPFFLIPGLLVLPILYLRDFSPKNMAAVALAGLLFIYIGVRPHYLQNKAFGGQNVKKIITALTKGGSGGQTSKTDSLRFFATNLTAVNGDLLLPDPRGYQDQSPTSLPIYILGMVVTVYLVGWATLMTWKGRKTPSPESIISILFISYLLFQWVIPKYDETFKPIRWLDSVYFPVYAIILGIILDRQLLKLPRQKAEVFCFLAVGIFLATNAVKWRTDLEAENRMKLKTVIRSAQIVAPLAATEKNINIMHIGNVNLNPTWPFSFALWKETSDKKYLRTLIWNIDPGRNEPFYIFSDVSDNTLSLSENIAKSYQDYPQSLRVNVGGGFMVEKIFNEKK